jgi:DNA-directed RNA polymerase alpha subunit
MNITPEVQLINEKDDTLSFMISGLNVSLVNGLRRIILSDIPIVVFRTTPYEENKAKIYYNTSRLNNEVLKQRLSCIPIHIKDKDFPYKNYIVEINVENITDTTIYVTTENFVIKDLITDKPISEQATRAIFPPNDYTGHFIDFIRLRPRLTDELPGEKIHLTCELDIGTAKQDGMFNVVSTCSYGFTVNETEMESKLAKKRKDWKDEGKNEKEIDFETENWKLLDGMRITKKDSFDFNIQSIGIYSNNELLDMGCSILIEKLDELDTIIEKDELEIINANNTMSNCFDVILKNEDYTIGKIVEYFLFSKYFENPDTKILNFCGFKKMHPHDKDSIIRLAYMDALEKSSIKGHLKECIDDAKKVYVKLQKQLLKLTKN